MPVSGVLLSLLEYWQQLPRASKDSLPCRVSLNPLELIELLPRVALLKRLDRYNVQASMMNLSDSDVWHRPFVGINAFDLTAPFIKESRAQFYEAVLDHPAAAHMRESVTHKGGHDAIAKSLYLPLANREGRAAYIMACTVYERRRSASTVSNRLVLDHQDVREMEFIDIGGGLPSMRFERPEPRTNEDNDLNWWQRLMPSKHKGTHASGYDA